LLHRKQRRAAERIAHKAARTAAYKAA